jgi:hypothetical protein
MGRRLGAGHLGRSSPAGAKPRVPFAISTSSHPPSGAPDQQQHLIGRQRTDDLRIRPWPLAQLGGRGDAIEHGEGLGFGHDRFLGE